MNKQLWIDDPEEVEAMPDYVLELLEEMEREGVITLSDCPRRNKSKRKDAEN